MKRVLKNVKKAFDVLCWILIGALVLLTILAVAANASGEVPSLFGYSVYRVSSASMEPELMVGDIILGKKVDDVTTVEVGDVITYEGSGELAGMLITHEVIVAPQLEDGKLMLQTQGIANDIPDSPITADRVVSVMVCEVSFLNGFYSFFLSPWGLLTIIGLIILIFIDELIVLIKTITGNNNEKREDINEIINRLQSENTNSDERNPDENSDSKSIDD